MNTSSRVVESCFQNYLSLGFSIALQLLGKLLWRTQVGELAWTESLTVYEASRGQVGGQDGSKNIIFKVGIACEKVSYNENLLYVCCLSVCLVWLCMCMCCRCCCCYGETFPTGMSFENVEKEEESLRKTVPNKLELQRIVDKGEVVEEEVEEEVEKRERAAVVERIEIRNANLVLFSVYIKLCICFHHLHV